MNSAIPEEAAGSTARTIMSDGGVLQVLYVKVLEKGDTYEIVRRSLPKKLKTKNDLARVEKIERKLHRLLNVNKSFERQKGSNKGSIFLLRRLSFTVASCKRRSI